MEIFCLKNDLKKAVLLCEKISSKNINLPILSNILINTEEKELKLTATNLELGVTIAIPAKIEKEGKIIIPATILNNLLFNIQEDGDIFLELKDNNLIISTKNNSALIKNQIIDDFPILPKIKTDQVFSIPTLDFISGLKSVLYACSLSNAKPEISSIFLYSDKNKMFTFAATDSFRLAEKKINYLFDNFGPILIPFKTAVEIIRIFDGYNGNLDLYFNKNQINIESDNIKFVSKLTDGVFPDYNQIIPKKFSTDVIIDKNLFINSLKISSVFLGKLNDLNLIVNSGENFLITKTSNNNIGENISKIPAEITGEPIKITFNHKYIFDCLPYIDSEKIILRFSGDGKPLLILGIKDNNFQYLAMPMNV